MAGKLEFTHEENLLRPAAQATVSAVSHRLAELGPPALSQLFPASRARVPRGHAEALVEKYTEVLRRHSQPWGEDLAEVLSRRSTLHFSLGALHQARDDAARCVELQPLYTVGYYRLGLAHFALGDFPAAAHAFRAGLKVSPGNERLTRAFHHTVAEWTAAGKAERMFVAAPAALQPSA